MLGHLSTAANLFWGQLIAENWSKFEQSVEKWLAFKRRAAKRPCDSWEMEVPESPYPDLDSSVQQTHTTDQETFQVDNRVTISIIES